MHPARRVGSWRHTFHTPVPACSSTTCSTAAADDRVSRSAEVVRIDEAPGDRSRGVFGSDHHPLLARIELNGH
jgi:hypothetical protein